MTTTLLGSLIAGCPSSETLTAESASSSDTVVAADLSITTTGNAAGQAFDGPFP